MMAWICLRLRSMRAVTLRPAARLRAMSSPIALISARSRSIKARYFASSLLTPLAAAVLVIASKVYLSAESRQCDCLLGLPLLRPLGGAANYGEYTDTREASNL